MTDANDNATAKAISGTIAKLLQAPSQMAAAFAGALTQRSCASGCEIPTPCWEPRHAGNCTLEMTPGSSTTIRIRVSNCGWSRQFVAMSALGQDGWLAHALADLVVSRSAGDGHDCCDRASATDGTGGPAVRRSDHHPRMRGSFPSPRDYRRGLLRSELL